VPNLRTLQPGDEGVLETFLSQYPDTSMFLRSNLRDAGLVDYGARFQGTYVAAIEDEVVTAVAAHYWNGMIVVQAPIHLEAVVQIGGVWTPPNLRGKGYAKCVVAGSLISAQSQKVSRAVLCYV
jgi:predicted GNAT family acetyltransferase